MSKAGTGMHSEASRPGNRCDHNSNRCSRFAIPQRSRLSTHQFLR